MKNRMTRVGITAKTVHTRKKKNEFPAIFGFWCPVIRSETVLETRKCSDLYYVVRAHVVFGDKLLENSVE